MLHGAHRDSPLKQRTRDGILTYWAGELGVNVPELQSPNNGVRVTSNITNPGIMIFRRGSDVRIAASPIKIELMRDEFPFVKAGDFCSQDFWHSVFPSLCGDMVGPTRYYYLDTVPETWIPPPTSRTLLLVRGLAASDIKICAEFAQALTHRERELSGFDTLGRHAWGVFARGELVSIASFDAWPNRVAHIGIATHPEHRGNRFAQLAMQAAIRGAVVRKRIAQYGCLVENVAAGGVAKALGMSFFAETLLIHQRV